MSTHHQLFYHLLFSTKNRKPDLQPETRETMFEYLGGTVRGLVPSVVWMRCRFALAVGSIMCICWSN